MYTYAARECTPKRLGGVHLIDAGVMNRVKEVKALPNYRLAVMFRNGEHGVFDCNPYR